MWGYNLMLFYSYAELIIGLVAIFYFTSKIFSITKYKLYFVLSLIFIISTASFACFIKSIDISSDFTGIQQKDDVDILFSVLFGINIFYLYHISIIMFNFTYKINHSKFYRLWTYFKSYCFGNICTAVKSSENQDQACGWVNYQTYNNYDFDFPLYRR